MMSNSIITYLMVSLITSMACYQLLPIYNDITYAFFQYLSLLQQISIFVLFFMILFISISFIVDTQQPSSPHGRRHHRRRRNTTTTTVSKEQYPLQEIDAATNDTDKFKCLFPTIKQNILQYLQTENELMTEGIQWIDTMMEYSVPGGKLNRGTTVVAVCRTMKQQYTPYEPFTSYDVARAAIAGWTIELLQAFFLVADDIMDDSITRRGQPCWYKLDHVQLIAINDSFLLESFVYTIIQQHFQHESYYYDFIELLLDVTQKTEIGQLLDLTSQAANAKTLDLSRFTYERYTKIVQYKTSYYSFYLPIAMGMIMAGIPYDTQSIEYQQAKKICCLMGEYFQIQDDYLDCYGTPEQIGKIGTDIQDKKCSWLIVQALQICNTEQRQIIQDNYGIWDDNKVNIIKQLYNDLQLSSLFQKYEEESYQKIQNELVSLSSKVPKSVYMIFLNKIYQRSK